MSNQKQVKDKARAKALARRIRVNAWASIILAEAKAALAEGRVHAQVHATLARWLEVTRAYKILILPDASRPVAILEDSMYLRRVVWPDGRRRTVPVPGTREIHVGRAWLRRNLRSLSRAAAEHRCRAR